MSNSYLALRKTKLIHFDRHSAWMLCFGCGSAVEDDGESYWTEDGAKARSFLSPVRVSAFAQADLPGRRQAWELLPQDDSE